MLYDFIFENSTLAYILVIITVIFAYIIQAKLRTTFNKYNKVISRRNVPANVIARQILDSYNLYDVKVTSVSGDLSDHYDPRSNVVALSESTFNSASVAAIGIAAHEVGHAIQHNTAYMPIKIRSVFVPFAQIGSYTWAIFFLLGMLMSFSVFIDIAIVLFAIVTLFQILTLPVEFDASKRALEIIQSQDLLDHYEICGTRKTLSAAAMTYVAGLMVATAQLFRLLVLSNRRH